MGKPDRQPVIASFAGAFEISDDGMMVVFFEDKRSQPTKLGDVPTYILAQHLLGELVTGTSPKPKRRGVTRAKVLF